MADVFFTLGVLCFALAVPGLVATGILFFRLRIAEVIAELSGKTATDAIAKIRRDGPIRQHRGKSLQSILDNAPSDDFSLSIERAGLSASGAGLAVVSSAPPAETEPQTTLLAAQGTLDASVRLPATAQEGSTTLLAQPLVQPQPAQSPFAPPQFPQSVPLPDPPTTLLDNQSEGKTTLLSDK